MYHLIKDYSLSLCCRFTQSRSSKAQMHQLIYIQKGFDDRVSAWDKSTVCCWFGLRWQQIAGVTLTHSSLSQRPELPDIWSKHLFISRSFFPPLCVSDFKALRHLTLFCLTKKRKGGREQHLQWGCSRQQAGRWELTANMNTAYNTWTV